MSTCKGCESKITKEDKYMYSGKAYCKKCYDTKLAEAEDYKKLINVVCQYFKIDAPTGLLIKQIKDYKDQYNYTYSGIGYCLWYVKDIERRNFDIKFGIALVKYYYEKAKEYYEQQNRISQSINIEKPIEKIKTITIKNNKNKKKNILIDIDSLLQGGEK